jgi:hypothetical protein
MTDFRLVNAFGFVIFATKVVVKAIVNIVLMFIVFFETLVAECE